MTTTTTLNQPNQRSSRRPSSRDLEIFHQAEILGLTHAEIALDWRLTRRRVSQIVARVRRWLSLHPCYDPHLASELQRKQLARHTERMHLQHVIGRARNELIHGKRELTTTTTKDDGTSTTTVRQQPFNVQVLKTYLRAVQALAKLQQQPDVNIPTPELCQFPWLEGAISEVYDKWYHKIWSGQLKPQGIFDLVEELNAAVLKAAATQARFASEGATGNDPQSPNDSSGGTPCKGVAEGGPGHHPEGTVEGVARAPTPERWSREANHGLDAATDVGQQAPSVGRGSPDPAQTATEGLPSAKSDADSTLDVAPWALDQAPDSAHAADEPNPKSKIENPKSPSLTSLPEALASTEPVNSTDVTTASTTETCTASSPTETSPPAAPPSPENPKREVPPPSASPSL